MTVNELLILLGLLSGAISSLGFLILVIGLTINNVRRSK